MLKIQEVVKEVTLVAELLNVKSSVKLAIWQLKDDKVLMVASTEYDTQVNCYGSALENAMRLQKMLEEIKRTIDKIGGTYKLEKWEKPFFCDSDSLRGKLEPVEKFPCYFKDDSKERVEQGIQFQLELPAEKAEAANP